ncbi:MAG: acylphosphatase [Candidatus Neomarinimicrobiota bacterium]|nr:acylphosphatase [Candidatus Neomarinimicrobiota bacterium]
MRVLKAKVYGKVQGVWFRKYTLDSARDIGVVGMVKNLVDGTVLVNASGKDENLRKWFD